MSVLMIFLDGFGLGARENANPYHQARTPFFDRLLGGHLLYSGTGLIKTPEAVMIPTDATLQVSGLPQSATGQVALWTGINAAQMVGRHVQAFPNAQLRAILAQYSIFRTLANSGRKAAFANAYRPEYFEKVDQKKARYSSSTLAVMSGGQMLRGLDDLRLGQAVYQDFTNRQLLAWGYDVEKLSPKQAGATLAAIARDNDFTLYEYFITDRVGHKQEIEAGVDVLEQMDVFLAACVEGLDSEEDLVLLVSDHGNFEDMTVAGHTMNPVPTLIIGEQPGWYCDFEISSLVDVTPFVLQYLGIKGEVCRG